jgi:hypothetical protein
MSKVWDRTLWGIEFSSGREKVALIGGAWHDAMIDSRFKGEPTRALLFTTRAHARAWCIERMERYNLRPYACAKWRFRPVRVRETVRPQPQRKR